MRVFGILVLLLLAGAALFLFLFDDNSDVASNTNNQSAQNNDRNSDAETAAMNKADRSSDTKSEKKDPQSSEGKQAEVPSRVAALSQEQVAKPIIIEKKKPASPMPKGITRMADPSFDIVRVDANCGILVAGRAEPTADVHIFANETVIGSVTANGRGEWVFISAEPLSAGTKKINVKATNPNGQNVETARLVVMQVPDCSIKEENRAPAIAVLTPKDKNDTNFENRVSKLLQMPEPQGDLRAAKNLAVGSVDYDEKGNVALSGKGTPGNEIQIYMDNKSIGSAVVDKKGNWTLAPKQEIPAGNYKLRTDQLNKSGKVISRVEMPFQRASADEVLLAKGGLEIRAIVQPGNSLWRIARRMYGEGTQYTTIYQANQEQIKNPDLIFPGQIFKLPSEKIPN